jgi:hypothetical protein
LAGDAVQIGPVSIIISLLTGNFTGNFRNHSKYSLAESLEVPVVWGYAKQIPYGIEQGILLVKQGIPSQELGRHKEIS